jgi:single-strand DNA-binding protein
MYSLNRATILGNLTRDPELRYTPNGQAVLNFGVATNRRYKNSSTGEVVEDTQFHDVVAWGKLAETINQFFKKGSKIYLEGRLQTRNWEAPDGSKRYRTEIIMENFIPLTPKEEVEKIAETTPASAGQTSTQESTEQAKPTAKKETDSSTPPAKKTTAKPADDEEFNLDDIPF